MDVWGGWRTFLFPPYSSLLNYVGSTPKTSSCDILLLDSGILSVLITGRTMRAKMAAFQAKEIILISIESSVDDTLALSLSLSPWQ